MLELRLCQDYSNFSSGLIFFNKQDSSLQGLGATPQFSIRVPHDVHYDHIYCQRCSQGHSFSVGVRTTGTRCCTEQQLTLEGGERHRNLD